MRPGLVNAFRGLLYRVMAPSAALLVTACGSLPSPSASHSSQPQPSDAPNIVQPQSAANCPALVVGQAALPALEAPPAGYHGESALAWSGCGAERLPKSGPVAVPDVWFLGEAHTCPPGIAASEDEQAVTIVAERQVAGRVATQSLEETGASSSSVATAVGPDDQLLVGGRLQLQIEPRAPNCRWTIAMYLPD